MSCNFTIGDKVVCINNNTNEYLTVGNVYTIACGPSWGDGMVTVEEVPNQDFFISRFELIQPQLAVLAPDQISAASKILAI